MAAAGFASNAELDVVAFVDVSGILTTLCNVVYVRTHQQIVLPERLRAQRTNPRKAHPDDPVVSDFRQLRFKRTDARRVNH